MDIVPRGSNVNRPSQKRPTPFVRNTPPAPKGSDPRYGVPEDPLTTEMREKGPLRPSNSLYHQRSFQYLEEVMDKLKDEYGKATNDSTRAAIQARMNAVAVQLNFHENFDLQDGFNMAYLHEFHCWVLGKSKFNTLDNVDQRTKKKTPKTPWGNRRLVGEDIDQYLFQFVDKKIEFERKLAKLALFPPQDIKSAWLYFKYLVCPQRWTAYDYLRDFNWWTEPGWSEGKLEGQLRAPRAAPARQDQGPAGAGDPGEYCEPSLPFGSIPQQLPNNWKQLRAAAVKAARAREKDENENDPTPEDAAEEEVQIEYENPPNIKEEEQETVDDAITRYLINIFKTKEDLREWLFNTPGGRNVFRQDPNILENFDDRLDKLYGEMMQMSPQKLEKEFENDPEVLQGFLSRHEQHHVAKWPDEYQAIANRERGIPNPPAAEEPEEEPGFERVHKYYVPPNAADETQQTQPPTLTLPPAVSDLPVGHVQDIADVEPVPKIYPALPASLPESNRGDMSQEDIRKAQALGLAEAKKREDEARKKREEDVKKREESRKKQEAPKKQSQSALARQEKEEKFKKVAAEITNAVEEGKRRREAGIQKALEEKRREQEEKRRKEEEEGPTLLSRAASLIGSSVKTVAKKAGEAASQNLLAAVEEVNEAAKAPATVAPKSQAYLTASAEIEKESRRQFAIQQEEKKLLQEQKQIKKELPSASAIPPIGYKEEPLAIKQDEGEQEMGIVPSKKVSTQQERLQNIRKGITDEIAKNPPRNVSEYLRILDKHLKDVPELFNVENTTRAEKKDIAYALITLMQRVDFAMNYHWDPKGTWGNKKLHGSYQWNPGSKPRPDGGNALYKQELLQRMMTPQDLPPGHEGHFDWLAKNLGKGKEFDPTKMSKISNVYFRELYRRMPGITDYLEKFDFPEYIDFVRRMERRY